MVSDKSTYCGYVFEEPPRELQSANLTKAQLDHFCSRIFTEWNGNGYETVKPGGSTIAEKGFEAF